jgi:hypothetical protein
VILCICLPAVRVYRCKSSFPSFTLSVFRVRVSLPKPAIYVVASGRRGQKCSCATALSSRIARSKRTSTEACANGLRCSVTSRKPGTCPHASGCRHSLASSVTSGAASKSCSSLTGRVGSWTALRLSKEAEQKDCNDQAGGFHISARESMGRVSENERSHAILVPEPSRKTWFATR